MECCLYDARHRHPRVAVLANDCRDIAKALFESIDVRSGGYFAATDQVQTTRGLSEDGRACRDRGQLDDQ